MSEQKLNEKMTLVRHTVCFPTPSITNKHSEFGLDESELPKEAVSLGKKKLFPPRVWEQVYGNYKGSPMDKMCLIRSRLQAHIEKNTFEFLKGVHVLPDKKLIEFRGMVKLMEEQFNESRDKYIADYATLVEASVTYWRARADDFKMSQAEIEQLVRNRMPKASSLPSKFKFSVQHFELKAPSLLVDSEGVDPEVIAARQQVYQETVESMKHDMFELKKDMITSLREDVMDAIKSLDEAIDTGKWNQKSLNALKEQLNRVESMNIMDDKQLQKEVDLLRDRLKTQKADKLKKNSFDRDDLRDLLKKQRDKIMTMKIPEIQEELEMEETSNEILGVGRIVNPF